MVEEEPPGLLVQSRFRIGHDEEAFDGEENSQQPCVGRPVFLERVHADLPRIGGNIRMKYSGQKIAFGR